MADTQTARTLMPDSINSFTALVHAVDPSDWTGSTPCTDWSVRDLVNHVTGEHLWVPHLLGGGTIAEVGSRYDGDVLGSDPVATWDAAASVSAKEFAAASDSQPVHLSFGDTPLGEYADQMLTDLVIHGWDLARSIGVPPAPDPAAVAHVTAYLAEHVEEWRGFGFKDAVTGSYDSPLDRLIALSGRRP
ncbi:TIGR03086 family metal-binding protein [Tenggerimyces flavus]|uniref:TIGR03086 family metal-binding protein n=1 Tax=Tenggerimyces flavus TaxID=1708749 RepID=A0ABV7YGP3_9ACTN|nr:TIGR03086 family metal-binding protein [Tenggerimyces flavus]MBM7783971.1 uncharacterized protein (TIGR03086 family) [Tenggerimyces flavus]